MTAWRHVDRILLVLDNFGTSIIVILIAQVCNKYLFKIIIIAKKMSVAKLLANKIIYMKLNYVNNHLINTMSAKNILLYVEKQIN